MYPKKTLSLAIAALSGCMALSAAYNVTGKLDNNGGSRIFLVTQTGKNTMDTHGSRDTFGRILSACPCHA